MEANELMIGDWVNFGSFIRQVIQSDYYQDVNGDCVLDGVKPIPLTAEILKKNGFVPDNFSPYYLPIKDGSVRFSKHQYGLYCNILRPYQRYDGVCNYVHNLQHALRLCGLNDLADNFKV